MSQGAASSSSVALKQCRQTPPNHSMVRWFSSSSTPSKPGSKLASCIWQPCFRPVALWPRKNSSKSHHTESAHTRARTRKRRDQARTRADSIHVCAEFKTRTKRNLGYGGGLKCVPVTRPSIIRIIINQCHQVWG